MLRSEVSELLNEWQPGQRRDSQERPINFQVYSPIPWLGPRATEWRSRTRRFVQKKRCLQSLESHLLDPPSLSGLINLTSVRSVAGHPNHRDFQPCHSNGCLKDAARHSYRPKLDLTWYLSLRGCQHHVPRSRVAGGDRLWSALFPIHDQQYTGTRLGNFDGFGAISCRYEGMLRRRSRIVHR